MIVPMQICPINKINVCIFFSGENGIDGKGGLGGKSAINGQNYHIKIKYVSYFQNSDGCICIIH